MNVVIDTNIFLSALQRHNTLDRRILELCFKGQMLPLIGDALYYEYDSVLRRDHLFRNSTFTERERQMFFDDFCSICKWVPIYFHWRPNLPDEGDNHLIELGRAGNAKHIITWNRKGFRRADLIIDDLMIVTPEDFMSEQRKRAGAT